MTNQSKNYISLNAALEKAGASIPLSECHGVASGLLAANTAADESIWLTEILKDADPQNYFVEEARTQLIPLFSETRQQLNDNNLEFNLMIPPDDETLANRVQAIQDWCIGVIYGLAVAGITNLESMPEDSQSFLQDLAQLSQSEEFDLDDEEESEEAYTQITEYLKVGLLLLAEELQPSKLDTQIH